MSQASDYLLSAAYVRDAVEGNFYLAGHGHNILKQRQISERFLKLQSHWLYSVVIILVSTIHCMLAVWEEPQMVIQPSSFSNTRLLWAGIACVALYIIDIFVSISYTNKSIYFTYIHCKIYCIIVVLFIVDFVIYFAAYRMIFRFLRPCILLLRIRSIRGTALVMLGVIPKFLQFFLILTIYIALFATIGVNLFMDIYSSEKNQLEQHEKLHHGVFNNIGIAMLTVFVIMTGGSYPRVMIPAYKRAQSSAATFFITVILTGEIILYAILVARIYDFYVEANKIYVKKERFRERQCLIKAFQCLDVDSKESAGYNSWEELLTVLLPKASVAEIRKRFLKLKSLARENVEKSGSSADTNAFTLVEFFLLPEILQFTIEKSTTSNSKGCLANIIKSKKLLSMSRKYTRSTLFSTINFACYVAYAGMLALTWWNMAHSVVIFLKYFNATLLLLIVADVGIKVLAQGMTPDLKFNSIVVSVSVVLSIISYSAEKNRALKGWTYALSHNIILMRFAVLATASSMLHWVRRMAPPLLILFSITVIALYSYAILGMELFGYLKRQNEEPMSIGISLCKYGFEHLGCSLLTLFQVSLGSSWYKVMKYIMDKVGSWSALYFVIFYALMQMLVLNVVSAVVVQLSNVVYHDEVEAKRLTDIGMFSPHSSRRGTSSKKTNEDCSSTIQTINLVQELRHEETETSFSRNSNKTEKITVTKTVTKHVTLSERKAFGNWNRDIASDMTFLNADELRLFQSQMGISTTHLQKVKPRKSSSSTTCG